MHFFRYVVGVIGYAPQDRGLRARHRWLGHVDGLEDGGMAVAILSDCILQREPPGHLVRGRVVLPRVASAASWHFCLNFFFVFVKK